MGPGDAVLAGKFAEVRPHLDERAWRLYLGSEARALAAGGGTTLAAAAAVVAAAAGVSRATVLAGAGELAEGAEPLAGRVRRPGAGRRKAEDAQPGLAQALAGALEATVRGDPVSAVTWTTLSLRDLEREMARLGFACRKDALARMLHEAGFSLQGMSRVLEGRQHPDRDAQFGRINAAVAEFAAAGEPAVSVDGKKKEQLGAYYRAGRSWRPAGDPVQVRDHDFADPGLGKAVPYGVCDIAANRGFVVVGTSRETAVFAAGALRRWWLAEGTLRYPRATRLLVTCDAGGSSACASRGWKDGLARLAEEAGLEIRVCHFPPGTSKWNKIEHRLFCHVTRTWKARPLMTKEDAVAGIAATVTVQGLKCTAVLDEADYPAGVETSGRRVKYLEDRVLDRGPFHGEWNYTLLPAPRPGPEQEPEHPGPDLALPAALAAAAGLPVLPGHAWTAGREHRLAVARGRPRLRNGGGGYSKLTPQTILAAAACHVRLSMTWTLLGQVLGVDRTTVSIPGRHAVRVLEDSGITAQPGTPRIRTAAAFRDHAAALGITINDLTGHKTANPQNTDRATHPSPPTK